eukprot:335554-Chlamydomonas_euryale.AAC.1
MAAGRQQRLRSWALGGSAARGSQYHRRRAGGGVQPIGARGRRVAFKANSAKLALPRSGRSTEDDRRG